MDSEIRKKPERVDSVVGALENPEFSWRTVAGIARESGLTEAEVLEVLSQQTDLLFESSVLSKSGERLFTTRRQFRKTATALDKLRGAFKNRIR